MHLPSVHSVLLFNVCMDCMGLVLKQMPHSLMWKCLVSWPRILSYVLIDLGPSGRKRNLPQGTPEQTRDPGWPTETRLSLQPVFLLVRRHSSTIRKYCCDAYCFLQAPWCFCNHERNCMSRLRVGLWITWSFHLVLKLDETSVAISIIAYTSAMIVVFLSEWMVRHSLKCADVSMEMN